MQDFSSLRRNQIQVPWSGRVESYHWTTREFLSWCNFKSSSSWRVSAMLPAYACRLVTRLLHLYSIQSSMGTSGSWLCLWRLITPSHLLKRSRPSWLIHLHLWLLPCCHHRSPSQGWSKGRVGVGRGYGIRSLWLITRKQPTGPALFVKWENKGLLLLKKKKSSSCMYPFSYCFFNV